MIDLEWSLYCLVNGFAAFGIGLNSVLLGMHLCSIIYSKFFMNKRPPDLPATNQDGVSILKPLKGIDPSLEGNLETFFNLDYPKYEILFCIQDKDDPANELVRNLINKYSSIDARIISGGKRIGPNPKINNLMPAYETMKYNLFWICDAGIRVLPQTLSDLVSKMTENVALVHAAPYVVNRKGFSSSVEKIYFATQHSRVYITANVMGFVCSTGMSNLIRKDYFEKATGGLKKFSKYIAEDYFMAKLLWDSGYKLALASYPALQNSGNYGLKSFVIRMIRWTKLRIFMIPGTVALEPFSECFVAGLIFSWACMHSFQWNMLLVFLLHIFLWFIFDCCLYRSLENAPIQMRLWDILLAWFIRETLTPYIILSALYDPTISWRTGKYRLKCGGKVEETNDV